LPTVAVVGQLVATQAGCGGVHLIHLCANDAPAGGGSPYECLTD
jgi:hypothetical protein